MTATLRVSMEPGADLTFSMPVILLFLLLSTGPLQFYHIINVLCQMLIPKKYFSSIINRPGVAGAVLQSASSFHWVSQPFPHNLQNIINHKPEELGSWNLERMFTLHNMSHVTCHVRVTCHVSHVRCHMSHFFPGQSLSVKGLLSTGPTPSSL